jgi:hypothetical protein
VLARRVGLVDGVVRHLCGARPSLPDPHAPQFSNFLRGGGYIYTPGPTADITRWVPYVFDQDMSDDGTNMPLGSCTSNAWLLAAAVLYVAAGRPAPVFSRLFHYFIERVNIEGGSPADDSGAQSLSGGRALQMFGVCLDSTWPYQITRFADVPPDEAFREALQHRALRWYALTANASGTIVDWIRAAITIGKPVLMGFSVPQHFTTETIKTGICDLPRTDDTIVGGHEVVAVKYDINYRFPSGIAGGLFCVNSWGLGFGAPVNDRLSGGGFWLPMQYFDEGLAFDPATLHEETMP